MRYADRKHEQDVIHRKLYGNMNTLYYSDHAFIKEIPIEADTYISKVWIWTGYGFTKYRLTYK